MIIVGINAGHTFTGEVCDNGASACLIDDQIAGALAEERISGLKYAGGYEASLSQLLAFLGLKRAEVDLFSLSFFKHPIAIPRPTLAAHARMLGIEGTRQKLALVPSHHLSHAYHAFFTSPFEEAIICVWDHQGSILGDPRLPDQLLNFERQSYYLGRGNEVALLEHELYSPADVAFGRAYAAATRYVGLGDYLSAGKLMGLSAYGNPARFAGAGDIWAIDSHGKLQSLLNALDGELLLPLFLLRHGCEVRPPGTSLSHSEQWYRDLASYVQTQVEAWAVRRVQKLISRTGIKNICVAGGVGLNTIVNSKIEERLEASVFVPTYPSDPGQAMGNAIWGSINFGGTPPGIRRWPAGCYLGTRATNLQIEAEFAEWPQREKYRLSRSEQPEKLAAELLARGKYIGWFQGRSEFGARALGNRSILADPRKETTRDALNKLKLRESFRPFAPAVMAEYASRWFDLPNSLLWPYMLGVADARADKASQISATVHVDGTSRVQVVREPDNPRFHRLIQRFEQITSVPVVLNTSLNAGSRPIVETPADALQGLHEIGLDCLVIEDFVIERR